MGTTGKVILGIVGGGVALFLLGIFGLVTCTMCAGAAISSGMNEMDREEAQEVSMAKRRIPWLATVETACQRYKAAPNDIQKSAVFQETQAFVQGKQLANVRGTLESASTGHGGGGLLLRTRVGGATFLSPFLGQNSPLYSQAATLTEGQCVVFTGQVRNTSPGFEESRVCDMDFSLEFSSITACPPGQKN